MPSIPSLTYEELLHCKNIIINNKDYALSKLGFVNNVTRSKMDRKITKEQSLDLTDFIKFQ